MFARTRYLTQSNKLAIMVENVKYKERLNNYLDVIRHNYVIYGKQYAVKR